MTNPLVAQRQDSTTWHSGINLIDDAAGVYDGVSSGNWVEGGIAAFGVGLDVLSMAMNPVGTLISYGLNFLIEHVQPLRDALNQLAGDADQIAAYAQTWKNVGKAVGQAGTDLNTTVTTDTANWTGQAADAYRANIGDKINHLHAAATCADTIGTAVEIVGVITGAVRMLVRDMVTQAIGDFIQDALEEVFSLGLGTPVVVAQVVSQVADWMEKIGAVIKKLINSVEKLRPLMSKLEEIFAAIKKVMSELHLHGGDEPRIHGEDPHGTSPAHADDPHGTTSPDGTHPTDGTTPSHADDPAPAGDGSTPRDTSPQDGTRPEDSNGGQRSEGNGGCDGKGGDPVDAVSGQMITSKTDVDLPGLLPLMIRRSYASGFDSGRLFGAGWSSTLDQRLEIDHLGIRYIGDDAQVLSYPHPARPDQPVLPDFGARWTLTIDTGTDTYRIEDRETGWTRHFGPNPANPNERPVSALTDRDGHRVSYTRDQDGRPVAVEHSGGYRVEVDTVNGPAGARVAALRLPDAGGPGQPVTVVSYQYDTRGRLTGVVNSSGLPYRYEYDDADRIVGWVDRNDFSYRYVYREDGRVVRGEGLGGYLNAQFDYDPANRVTTVTNSLGHATRFHYDEHNHLTKVVDPLGNTEVLDFDRFHRLLAYTDPLGNTTRYVRNADGDPVRVELPDGTRVEVDYDERWRLPTQVVRPGGAIWRHTYSGTGNLLATTDPLGAVASQGLDERGHLVTAIEPDGQRWDYTSDGAGRPLSITSPLGATTRYDYDAFGRLRSTRDSRGAETRYGWTVEGQLTWQAAPGGEVEELIYDREGNLVENRTSAGGTTRFEVGPFNLPIARTGRDGTRYVFTYDTELRLIRVTNPAGLTWDYELDAVGRRISETDFTGRRIAYRYDAAGRVVARTEQSQTVELVRDAEGRVIRRIDGERVADFSYDEAGRLRQASDGTTDLRYERDLLGRPLLESINGRAVRSEYDLLGRRTRRVTPSGVQSVWTYTPLRRQASLTGSGGSLAFDYDAGGREITRRLGAAATLTQGFDERGRLVAQQIVAAQAPIQERTYRYRPDGVVTAVGDRLSGDRSYQLTGAGRVTAVTGANWTEQYAYDALGNLTSAEPGAPADTTGLRVLDGFLLRSAGRSSYEYDTLGRLVRETRRTLSGQQRVWTYRWNGRNQLAEASTPDGQRWSYVYDPLGRRVAKQRLDEAGSVLDEVVFSWDGSQLAEQMHADGGRLTATAWDYRSGTGEPVAQTSRSWLADAPSEVIDTRFHAIVSDLAGSPTELVDAAGRIAWRQTISLWGTQLTVSTVDGTDCPLRFSGQYHDRETGLHYNTHRYYDPRTARYLTPDPLGLPAAPNHYTYVINPLTVVDPLGLASTRDPQGRYARDPNAPPNVHNRSTEYPHDYWDSTHDTMATNWTLEGRAQGGVPVDSHGVPIPRDQLTWVDATYGSDPSNPNKGIIPFDELTYDHNPPVVEHWNTEGYDQTRAEREAWYNNTDDMEAMTRAENGRKGALLDARYSDRQPGPNYSCS